MTRKKFVISDFNRIGGDLNVFCHPDRPLFSYTDGQQVEAKIYDIINNSMDLSCFSVELRSKIFDWASEYHLSPVRHNLLRHVPFRECESILEIGCGCGAITRQLGELGASVTAVEGSLSRIKCAASRCRDLSNVSFYCSNIWDMEFSEKYDYVTLIGVLEYAPLFIDSSNPVDDFLVFIKSLLKETGKLIIAIENQLGLKYFCGHEEDHVGIPFFGIEGRYNEKTAITFGKNNLLSILKKTGFEYVKFEYPFPDYKCPQFIFTEEAFSSPYFSPEQIIQQLEPKSYSGREIKTTFEQVLVWDVLAQNSMIALFSNSFLIFASPSPESLSFENEYFLAIGYSLNRSNDYKTKTEFFVKDDTSILVKKSKLIENKSNITNQEAVNIIKHDLSDQNYYSGENLEVLILKAIAKKDFESLINLLKIWIHFMVENGITEENQGDIYGSAMKANFIDCIPSNLIIQDSDKIIFFDKEWVFDECFSLRDVILRYLSDPAKESKYYSLVNLFIAGKTRPMLKLVNYLGIALDENHFQSFLLVNDHFYSSNQESYVNQYGTTTLAHSIPDWETTNKKLQQAQVELHEFYGFKMSIFFKLWSLWVKIRKKFNIPQEFRVFR